MKRGDLVRIIPEREGAEPYLMLWDDPPDFSSIYRKNHVGKFHYTDTGIILEQKKVLGVMGEDSITSAYWVKVLCSSGNIGWIKRHDLELVE